MPDRLTSEATEHLRVFVKGWTNRLFSRILVFLLAILTALGGPGGIVIVAANEIRQTAETAQPLAPKDALIVVSPNGFWFKFPDKKPGETGEEQIAENMPNPDAKSQEKADPAPEKASKKAPKAAAAPKTSAHAKPQAASALAGSGLQMVRVGGGVRVRGAWWHNTFNPGLSPVTVTPMKRWDGQYLRRRAIGDVIGGPCVYSYHDWDTDGPDYRAIEHRTSVNVTADFERDVTAYLELDSFDVWGEDFRSCYINGVDNRATSSNDVEIYQSYIEARNVFNSPIRVRIGRQEIELGSGWLVGNGSNLAEFVMLSHDAVRLTYDTERFAADLFWSKLIERNPIEEDGDVDFYGVYLSYKGIQDTTLDAYWLLVRDARAIEGGGCPFGADCPWSALDLSDYDPSYLNTVGVRAATQQGAWDAEAELAYQFGNADQIGSMFHMGVWSDGGAEFDAWGGHAEVGYAPELPWEPRFFAGGAYFGGEDNRDVSFTEWLNPFTRPEASISFNRLFSNHVYSYVIDEMGQLSNAWTLYGGIQAHPLDNVEVEARLAYFAAIETFDSPYYFRAGGDRILLLPEAAFWTRKTDSELGWSLGLRLTYRYSEDLEFLLGWEHFFTGDGLTDGNYVDLNGLLNSGGTGNADADYFYFQPSLQF
jgi:hypothetical protein